MHLDEADLVLNDEVENNFLLGDVIEQLVKLNFEERSNLKHPQTPNWLSLKLSLVGYPFSGTHTQAKFIKQRFGLDVFNIEDLVQEAIDCPAESDEPIPEASKAEEEETTFELSAPQTAEPTVEDVDPEAPKPE